jgi:nucleotide-binding universal stress UspA family protein
MPKIVAFVDGSIYAKSVCDHAAWAADRAGLPIELLHVLGRREVSNVPADLSGSLAADARATLLGELAERGRLVLDEALSIVRKAGISGVEAHLRIGDLVETVGEFEAEAEFIVVGKRGEAADFAKGHLGSNLERVVRSANRPVLVASRAFRPIKRFLLAFDNGPSARRAMAYIAASPLLQELDCHIVTVGDATAASQSKLAEAATPLTSAGFTVRSTVVAGEAEEVIGRYVVEEGIDLLVMGAYGHSRIRNLVIGSTTTAMVRQCRIPVFMFR